MTLFGAIAAAVAAVGAIYYASLTKSQLDQLKLQLPQIQSQAKSARQTADTAASQMRLDQRPWLKLQFAGAETKSSAISANLNQPLPLKIEIIDFGKTAALGVEASAVVELNKFGVEPHLPSPGKHGLYRRGEVIPPEARKRHPLLAVQEFHTGAVNPTDFANYTLYLARCCRNRAAFLPAMTEDDLIALRDKKAYIAVWGQIWYSDIFGIDHWTKFCTMQANDALPKSDKCADYNDTDRNYDLPSKSN